MKRKKKKNKKEKIHLRMAILGGSLHFGDLEVKNKAI